MTINHHHPTFTKFIETELRTLNYLGTNSYIANKFPRLNSDALLTYQIYSATKVKGRYSRPFQFSSVIDVGINGYPKSILLECQVGVGFAPTNFVMSIFQNQDGVNRLLRKFHFDYALPVTTEDRKPVYHLQYGGEITPGLANLNIDIEPIHSWLSSPRIFYSPVNLAILIDAIFCEFPSEETVHVARSTEWRKLIKHNEEILLTSFYQNVTEFINHNHNQDSLIRDFYYGG